MKSCIHCKNFLMCKVPDAINNLMRSITFMVNGKGNGVHKMLVEGIAERCQYFEKIEDGE